MMMKSKAAVCTLLAASLLTGPFALAQGDAPYAKNQPYYQQLERDHDRGRRQDARQHNDRRDQRYEQRHDRRDQRYDQRYDYRYRGERGVGPNHSYYRGSYLPPQYRTRHYVVDDWRGHRLSAPPRGYQWVQNGGDYILVAIATGVILNLLLSN